jgi:hypothetical protein
MRKAYLLFTLLCFAFSACKKSNTNDRPTTYVVNGIHDVEVSLDESDSWALGVQYVGPVQENVSLSIEGLPAGVIYDISPETGVPSFSTNVSFRDLSAQPGVYACKLVCNGSQTGRRSYDFNITVGEQAICGLLGTYTRVSSNCDTVTYTEVIAAVNADANTNLIKFSNFLNSGYQVTATVNCNTSTITIPNQPLSGNNSSISGSGTFTTTGINGISIRYTVIENGVSRTCDLTLLR